MKAGSEQPRYVHVLGAPLLVTTYADLTRRCVEWAGWSRPTTVAFSNTQIVTMIRHDPAFRRVMGTFDCLVSDSTPLTWCMNWAGAGLRDRVYGPAFMRYFLERAPAGSTHYLVGGSEECAERLRRRFTAANPGLRFVGGYHGRCLEDGSLDPADEARVLSEINRLGPDFLWICFGAPKQQRWAARYKERLRRGVVLVVGFAFEANAGLKPDAPAWMQRAGLTWLYRMATEPRRLGPRYLKYNTLFLWYLLRDGMRGRAWGPWPVAGSHPVRV
ncbi:WecB/TagA/CpsF family glycosyltransferase [Limisphaera ngatamarikiensis]|uniref:WecB/TagA/CpsF family glycosyltransferase n=1 Tax=Limisphaera ngatamarikiensis TaxID=1324935 RepID=A0A6M1RP23_9BACT|nr:WecB/TagA/CpsF family glycosyltransferase [Limisphaera ngatamarikiensis]NGO39177.1 WecB/TagA/CpsF family glycosyltransferase [Limisphaera ngatamarikiensis]